MRYAWGPRNLCEGDRTRLIMIIYQISLLIGILIVVPLGYWVRFAENTYWSSTFGAIAYTLFWIFLVQLLVPKASAKWTAIGVLLATCAIEFLQLW